MSAGEVWLLFGVLVLLLATSCMHFLSDAAGWASQLATGVAYTGHLVRGLQRYGLRRVDVGIGMDGQAM